MLSVGDSIELVVPDIDRASGRVIGWSEDRKTIFAELRLGLPVDHVRQLPELPPPSVLRCSFCFKKAEEVGYLIAGPSAYICSECVPLCAEILAKQSAESEQSSSPNL